MKDGTLVARRARLILDNGAYSADAPFFPQLAAMIAVGPYKVPNVFVDASLAYTNTTPSGSVRAPTAPQACWAVEQHMDSVAARARASTRWSCAAATSSSEGDEGPTRQVFDPIGAAETLDKAAEMIGYGRDLPDDEAIGIACGWWPSFSIASGAYVKLNADGSGDDRHRRPGVRHRRRDGAAAAGSRGARHAAGGLLGPLPGHRRRAVRLRRVGIADDLQQRPGRGRGGGGHPRAAADARPRTRWRRRAPTSSWPTAPCGSRARRPRASASRRCARRPRATSSCSAAGRALRRRCPRSTPPGAPAGWAWSRSWRRRSSRTPCTARSTARPASSGCSRSPRPTTRARC